MDRRPGTAVELVLERRASVGADAFGVGVAEARTNAEAMGIRRREANQIARGQGNLIAALPRPEILDAEVERSLVVDVSEVAGPEVRAEVG